MCFIRLTKSREVYGVEIASDAFVQYHRLLDDYGNMPTLEQWLNVTNGSYGDTQCVNLAFEL